jgi:hypothetical protein
VRLRLVSRDRSFARFEFGRRIIDDIIAGLKFDSVAEFVPPAADPFDHFAPKASEDDGNQQNLDSVFEWLWGEMGFPVCANEVSDGVVNETVEAPRIDEDIDRTARAGTSL